VGLILALAVITSTALAVASWPRAYLARALLVGEAMGATAGVLIQIVVLLPYLFGWGGRALYDFGGDWELSTALIIGLMSYGVLGTAVGFLGGLLASASRLDADECGAPTGESEQW
jgi:hypothetical protein